MFDAAAVSHGISLNSQLLKGPQIFKPLPSIIFHFREGAIGVCADIEDIEASLKDFYGEVEMTPETQTCMKCQL